MEAAALSNKEDRIQSSEGDEEAAAAKQDVLHKVPFMADLGKPSMDPLSVASASSTWKDEDEHHEERMKKAKAEMREVREENERLKKCLDEITKDYERLKRQFHEMSQREGKKSTQTSASASTINNDEVEEVDDMVSLTLGISSSTDLNKNNLINMSSETKKDHNHHKMVAVDYNDQMKQPQRDHNWGCVVGDQRNLKNPSSDRRIIHSPTDSEPNKDQDEAGGETWPPSKVLKTLQGPPPAGDDEVSQQNPPKKARVCVRARCDTPTMNDGCQWRKYGQKIAKGNPCPRAYYRCTGAPSCPVRKQVQRSVDDISILITTYEGTHNHPLPVSAMAMASTTSAAASMLLSGPSSSTSRPGLNPSSSAVTAAANLHGMNLYLSNNSNSKQYYLPNSSILSSSLNHPTITLDLTSNPPSTSSSAPFHKIPSTMSTYPPKYPFTSLDFGSSHQSNLMSWNNNGGYVNSNQAYNNITKQLPLHSNIYQACLQHITKPSTPPLPDTIAAATKAITSDPSFQSALAAALSSIIGGSGGGGGGETISTLSSYGQTVAQQGNNNVCASSSLMGKTGSGTSSQQGFQQLPPASLTCSNSKTPSSSSPGDSRDNTK